MVRGGRNHFDQSFRDPMRPHVKRDPKAEPCKCSDLDGVPIQIAKNQHLAFDHDELSTNPVGCVSGTLELLPIR